MASQASWSFRPNQNGLDNLLHDPGGPMGRYLTRLGNRVVTGAKQRANVDTGNMRSRIEFRLEVEDGGLVGYVAARTNYSFYVHEGFGNYYPGNPFLLNALQDALA